MKKYQKGEEPTINEMENFSKRFKEDQWKALIKNHFFIKNYDKDLNMLSIAAEKILANKQVRKLSDVIDK